MRHQKKRRFDHGIEGIELGWSPAGPPLMTVYCYLIDDVMIDTGPAHMQKEALEIARAKGVRQVLLTHHHEDHAGNAAAIGSRLGTRVHGHRITREKLKRRYPILPYQKLVWGKSTPVDVAALPERIENRSGMIVPVHTPGHARDHTVFFLPAQGVLFSGDLYLADHIKYFRSDEDIGTQIASLKTVLQLDFDILLCAHNPRETDGRRRIRRKLDFLENLYGGIVHLWKQGLSERQIFRRLRLKESQFIKTFCFGNVSMRNGVRSAVRHWENPA